MLLGLHLTLLIGPTIAVPAPLALTEALSNVEVTQSDTGRSGFQLTFQMGRSGPTDLANSALFATPLLQPFNRVILLVRFNLTQRVLMDGIITHQQLQPKDEPGKSTLTITGEDVSVMMDLHERSVEYIAMDETAIANQLILRYSQYGLTPQVIPTTTIDLPLLTERTPVQQDTDLQYLQDMAARFGYVFYIIPGPVPLTNTAYWGPPVRTGVPQSALSVNMGSESNVDSISFEYDAMGPITVSGVGYVADSDQTMPIEVFSSQRPPLASMPAIFFNQPNVRSQLLRDSGGLDYGQALARAIATVESSVQSVVTVSGDMDAQRYGDLLIPRALVGLRGAGFSYDGLYYVKSVTHSIRKGEYRQRFTLNREGTGALTPTVIP